MIRKIPPILFALALTALPAVAQDTEVGAATEIGAPGVGPESSVEDAPEAGLAPDTASVVAVWLLAPGTVFDATGIDLADLQYIARPLIVIADSPNDPLVREQLDLLLVRVDELIFRDVIIILDTDPSANSAVRAQLRPRGFSMVLIGKDGRVALRKPVPWAVREIVHTIDRLPIRQQELRGN